MLTEELQVNIVTGILEPCCDCVGYANLVFRDDFVAGLASEVALSLRRYLLFAFWTASKVHLPLIIVHDALEVP